MALEENSWHALSVEQVVSQLETDVDTGLSEQSVKERQEKYGKNQLKEAPGRTIWQMAYDQLREPLILILLVSAVISGLMDELIDTFVILAIVVLNTILGVIQENKAEQSLAALKQLSAPMARVLRGGHVQDIPAAELVPGDIVLLEAGANVPADCRLIEVANLKCEEAALTGESVPVDKTTDAIENPEVGIGDRSNMAFSGTIVTYGRGKAVVVATGMDTEIGKIAEMIQTTEREPTPLQVKLAELSKVLGGLALALVVLVFFVGVFRGEPIKDMFLTSISLAVAAIPEGLPAIVTIVLALGVQRMAKRNAIIRKLPAVETLGTATAIASDKTGTLTQNEMTVARVYVNGKEIDVTGQGYTPTGEFKLKATDSTPEGVDGEALNLLLTAGALANDARLEKTDTGYRMIGDPTEGALVVAAEKYGRKLSELNKAWPRIDEIPFDSARKRMTTFHRVPEGVFTNAISSSLVAFTKGGPDVLLDLCSHYYENGEIKPLTAAVKEELLNVNQSMAADALRVLGVAYRLWDEKPAEVTSEVVEKDLIFVGFLGMIDPPRPEAKQAVKEAKTAGIRPMMVTGDHKATAAAIAKELGIMDEGDTVLTGPEIENMSDDELTERIEHTSVFARVSPEHKVRIVEALKRRHHIVAMTGDGVNDAPALKRADIGAAMGITGTDVAKEAADMVLADDNFATIVAAVREGRTIYANIQKAIHYLLSCNIGEIVGIFFAIMFGLGRPLTAIQILWVNLVTDGLPALALGMENPEPGVMERPPRDPKAGIFSGGLGWVIGLQGFLIGMLTLAAYYFTNKNALAAGMSPSEAILHARTTAFATLAFSQLFHAYNTRSRDKSVFKLGVFSNKYLNIAFLVSALLQVLVLTVPFFRPLFDTTTMMASEVLEVFLFSITPLVVVELVKLVFQRR